MKEKAIPLFFLFLIQLAFSQPKSSIPDYIITINNDTLQGSIIINNKGNYGYMSSVKYWNPINQKIMNYGANETKAFYFGERYFESLIWEDSHYYFERVVNQKPVSLYVAPYTSPGLLILPLSVKFNEYYIIDNFSMTRLNKLGFRKFMMNYVKNCPALVHKLEKEELKFNDLKQIVEEYNLCVRQ